MPSFFIENTFVKTRKAKTDSVKPSAKCIFFDNIHQQ